MNPYFIGSVLRTILRGIRYRYTGMNRIEANGVLSQRSLTLDIDCIERKLSRDKFWNSKPVALTEKGVPNSLGLRFSSPLERFGGMV